MGQWGESVGVSGGSVWVGGNHWGSVGFSGAKWGAPWSSLGIIGVIRGQLNSVGILELRGAQ